MNPYYWKILNIPKVIEQQKMKLKYEIYLRSVLKYFEI